MRVEVGEENVGGLRDTVVFLSSGWYYLQMSQIRYEYFSGVRASKGTGRRGDRPKTREET